MSIHFFAKGIIIGFSIAAPVGPIGILCIRRTLANGRVSGLVSGLGAATADGFYGTVAAFGLTVISNVLVGQQFWFRLIGGVFLFCLGARTFVSKPAENAWINGKGSLIREYSSTLLLTIANPMTILSFAAIFAGLGLGCQNGTFVSASMMVFGVVLGSALWWFILSGAVSVLKSGFNTACLKIVNQVSGVIIILFSVFALAGILRR